MVSKKEDAELIAQYITTRDPGLRDALVLRYVPLVYFVSGRLGISRSNVMDYEDLVSQGLIGLIEAVDRYDPGYGTQFSTYATLRIRGQMLDYLRAQDWLPRTARQRAQAVQQAVNDLWGISQRTPTNEEVAEHLGLPLPKVQQSFADASRVIVSLDSFINLSQEDDVSLHDVLADEGQSGPSQIFDEGELQARVMDTLKHLPEREQLVLSLYYYEELTLKEIGVVIGVSESRVCQLHARAVLNLRAMLAAESAPTPGKLINEDRR